MDELTFAPKLTNKRFKDLDGLIFGRLKVLGYAGRKGNNHYWHCQCNCGTVKPVNWQSLMRGNSTSCGCRDLEVLVARSVIHGESRGGNSTPEFRAYRAAKNRCVNPNCPDYKNYGERGIEFRFKSFAEFLATMGRKPSAKHSIDRVNNDGHYEPANCRWATRLEQNHNRRTPKIPAKYKHSKAVCLVES